VTAQVVALARFFRDVLDLDDREARLAGLADVPFTGQAAGEDGLTELQRQRRRQRAKEALRRRKGAELLKEDLRTSRVAQLLGHLPLDTVQLREPFEIRWDQDEPSLLQGDQSFEWSEHGTVMRSPSGVSLYYRGERP
jgi:hypothetical protein